MSTPFAAAGCANLPFAPKLTASVDAHASKADGTTFDVKLESAGIGQANIHKVDLAAAVGFAVALDDAAESLLGSGR